MCRDNRRTCFQSRNLALFSTWVSSWFTIQRTTHNKRVNSGTETKVYKIHCQLVSFDRSILAVGFVGQTSYEVSFSFFLFFTTSYYQIWVQLKFLCFLTYTRFLYFKINNQAWNSFTISTNLFSYSPGYKNLQLQNVKINFPGFLLLWFSDPYKIWFLLYIVLLLVLTILFVKRFFTSY